MPQTIDNINELPNYTILVSYEIFNVFPNIDTIKGIETIQLALQSRPSQKPFADCILQGLEICLYNNNSKFNWDHLLQTKGTVTGALNYCSYSDLAIHRLDKLINSKRNNNFGKLFFHGRYPNNYFVVWNGSTERLDSFHQFSNSSDEGLKFTMKIAKGSLCFLDLQISVVNYKLVTTVYSKPNDRHLYLQSNSCHNPKAIDIIQKVVALRIRGIC